MIRRHDCAFILLLSQVEYIRQAPAAISMATAPGNGEAVGDPTISTAAPSWHHPPRISLRWKNQKSGSDAALSEAYDYKVSRAQSSALVGTVLCNFMVS